MVQDAAGLSTYGSCECFVHHEETSVETGLASTLLSQSAGLGQQLLEFAHQAL